LRAAGEGELTFVGTSAGAINAALLAASSHLDPDEQAETLLELWRRLTVSDVFRSPVVRFPGVAARYAGQFLRIPGVRLTGLLDTAPLRRTAAGATDWGQFRANLDGGLAALAVVTTSGADNRTVVFVDRAGEEPLPPSDDDRPIDYVGAQIGPDHVLGSAAIPVLFPPVHISTHGWFLDGGVRLNAPLKPALSLGAEAVVVVATHPAVEPGDAVPVDGDGTAPDVDDTIVRLIDAALVDRMVEDVHTLTKVNALLAAGGDTGHKVVPYLFAGPAQRGSVGELAAEVFEQRRACGLRNSDLRVLGRLLIGDGPRRGDLLSFLYFDREFMEASIELGRRDAHNLLDEAEPKEVPWQTGPPRPSPLPA
jgi:NTE family protein